MSTKVKMTLLTKLSLLHMPNEILLLIFHQMATVQDACNLARSCPRLYRLFQSGRNKIDILRSAASVPWKPDYGLDKAFSSFIRIPPFNWRLQGAKQSTYILISVDYGPISEDQAAHAMLDLMTIQGLPQHLTSTFQGALETFLDQFHELNCRWPNYFERETEEMFSAAARLQLELLRESSGAIADLSSDTTVIALSLHCYLVVRAPDLIGGYTVKCTERELFEEGSPVILVEPGDDDRLVLPTIKVHKLKKWRTSHSPNPEPKEIKQGFHLDSGLDTMLEYITQSSFQLLDTQDPRHWPTVLHVLAILAHIKGSLTPHQTWLRKIREVCNALVVVSRDLARYYYVCTDGGKILRNHWDEEDYGRRVGQDQVAIEHARILNRLWLDADGGEWDQRGGKGIEHFMDKVEHFAYGCAVW